MGLVLEKSKNKSKTPSLKGEKDLDCKVVIDIDRLKKSMETETIIAPTGMSREERRKFILSFAN